MCHRSLIKGLKLRRNIQTCTLSGLLTLTVTETRHVTMNSGSAREQMNNQWASEGHFLRGALTLFSLFHVA